MPRGKSVDRELLELGARAKLAELEQEIAALKRRFPSLRGESTTPEPTSSKKGRGRKTSGGRKRMSASERAAVSARMKKFWAERKKGQKAARD